MKKEKIEVRAQAGGSSSPGLPPRSGKEPPNPRRLGATDSLPGASTGMISRFGIFMNTGKTGRSGAIILTSIDLLKLIYFYMNEFFIAVIAAFVASYQKDGDPSRIESIKNPVWISPMLNSQLSYVTVFRSFDRRVRSLLT